MKSIPAAQIFASGEEIDEDEFILNAYTELLDTDIKICIFVDSKD